MDGEPAEDAGMGQSMMTKRQQNGLDVHRAETGGPRLGADEERLRFVRDAMQNRIELARDRRPAKAPERKDPSAPS